jgi:hypothetical protein
MGENKKEISLLLFVPAAAAAATRSLNGARIDPICFCIYPQFLAILRECKTSILPVAYFRLERALFETLFLLFFYTFCGKFSYLNSTQ